MFMCLTIDGSTFYCFQLPVHKTPRVDLWIDIDCHCNICTHFVLSFFCDYRTYFHSMQPFSKCFIILCQSSFLYFRLFCSWGKCKRPEYKYTEMKNLFIISFIKRSFLKMKIVLIISFIKRSILKMKNILIVSFIKINFSSIFKFVSV